MKNLQEVQKANYKPLIVVGPSGVGKGTLIGALQEKYPNNFGFSVSSTTRGPRPGEIDGTHYHFVSMDQFQERVKNDEYIEYCNVHTNMYGTSRKALSDLKGQSKICILDIDIQGAIKVFNAK